MASAIESGLFIAIPSGDESQRRAGGADLAMDQRRSPRYPAVRLSEAINGVHLLWTNDRRTAMDSAELSKALGYRSQSGPARSLIGAMRQYGLLEKQDRGTGISDCAKVMVCNPARFME